MTRVLFDHQAFCMQTHGGVSRCFVELYRHLPEDIQATICLRESNNAYIRESGLADAESAAYDRWIVPGNWPCKGRLFNAWNWLRGELNYWSKEEYNRAEVIRQLKSGQFDIFHPTFFDDYFLPYLNGKPFVLTIHDMIPELYSKSFDARWDEQMAGKRRLATLANAIIAVSERTKEDVVRLLDIPADKVHVVYHGCSFPVVADAPRLVSEPYLLYVGSRSYYKNFDLFVRDVAPVLQRHPELKVVCTGLEFSADELAIMQQNGVQGRFLHYWVRDDAEFYSLYHFARCFVYSSEYEGFGIPILEAYQADCPVLLNRASCFPEIAGDAAVYFTMNRSESNFTAVLESFLMMADAELADLKRRQRERLSRYSWERSAQQLADVYRKIQRES
ncbi:MAG: glycosyltransferase family 4 protein [Bacteroidales bacterium]|nr:glycosyltransferase family 4 protein [Bacteroidales bacterium]